MFWRAALFSVALAAFVVAFAPLWAVVERYGFVDYAHAKGTIWDGVVEDARIGGLAAGNVNVRVSAPGLLRGRLEARAMASGPELAGDLLYEVDLSGMRSLTVETLAIEGSAFGRGGPGMSDSLGRTLLADVDIRFADGKCMSAKGQVESDVLLRVAERLGQTGLFLSGGAGCVGDSAQITLAGEDGPDAVRVSVALKADGSGSWRAEALTDKQALAAALADAGLTSDEANGALTGGGQFRWSPL